MNILPLIFSLLIIFSCLCATFLKEVKSLSLIEMTLEGYNHTEKEVRNEITKRAYKKIKEDALPNDPKKEVTKKVKAFSSKRSQSPPLRRTLPTSSLRTFGTVATPPLSKKCV